jgi:hypothetical protein
MACQNIDDYFMDVTPFFWTLVRDIALLEYDKLKLTHHFQLIQESIVNNSSYILRINGKSFYHDNLNDLFFNTLVYCSQNFKTDTELLLLERAVERMNMYVESEKLAEMLSDLL